MYYQVANNLEDLIRKHQRIPGNIAWALLERIRKKKIQPDNKEH